MGSHYNVCKYIRILIKIFCASSSKDIKTFFIKYKRLIKGILNTIQLEDIDVEAKLLPGFHLKPLRKLIDDKSVNNETLQVLTDMRDKMEDQIKAKECSNKAKLKKEKQKTNKKTLFNSFKKVTSQETATVELDPERDSSPNESESEDK